jgi:hypothetical protein
MNTNGHEFEHKMTKLRRYLEVRAKSTIILTITEAHESFGRESDNHERSWSTGGCAEQMDPQILRSA